MLSKNFKKGLGKISTGMDYTDAVVKVVDNEETLFVRRQHKKLRKYLMDNTHGEVASKIKEAHDFGKKFVLIVNREANKVSEVTIKFSDQETFRF